ncbi:hypothetical membrane protein [Corynebacterium renale]|uniref:DUF2269 domain-containing protein n=1 Tax=Corynebacterium renale TaxID=1724 RepID=UPI000DA2AE3F|nr:DUF2269 domain-containing protein [Corynebacterium renale]SQG64454.1 hypothetical membrane protein [Corynebacterium renale]STC95317.1 hypothetical membrane protein [Corynebacterium renale]
MNTVLLILHVLTAVLFLGPVTVATSTFHTHAMKVREGNPDAVHAAGAAKVMHKITNVYGILSLLVPMFGVAIMFTDMGLYFRDGRYHLSIGLAIIAWALLFFLIIPKQRTMMGALGLKEDFEEGDQAYVINDWGKAKKQLSMFGGIFALLWVVMGIVMFLPQNFGL